MAYSFDTYVGDGIEDTFTVTFPYIQKADVTVLVDGVSKTFTWPTDSTVLMDAVPGNGTTVVIKRTTGKSARLVDFTSASLLDEITLDKDSNQLFYIAQEAYDNMSNVLQYDSDDDKYNADSKVIKNVADGVAANDAVNVSQTTGIVTAAQAAKTAAETAEENVEVIAAGLNVRYIADSEEADQGATGNGKSIKALIAEIGSKVATIILPNSGAGTTTPYTLTTSVTIPANIELRVDKGTILDGAGTLTVSNLKAGLYKIFGSSITTVFGVSGIKEVYPQWWGATGDGSTDDTVAIEAACNRNNAVIYFPSGTYIVDEPNITSQSNLQFTGTKGAVLKRKTGVAEPVKLLQFTTCNDLIINGLSYDVNGVTNSSGINFNECKRVDIYGNRIWDSDPQGDTGNDHYGIVTQKGTNPSEDFTIHDNLFEGVQVETSHIKYCHVHHNISKNAQRTIAFGGTSLGDAGVLEDIQITNNIIINPARYGVGFQLDPPGSDDSTFKRILIDGNLIIKTSASVSVEMIKLGHSSIEATTGNVFEDIQITNNNLYFGASAGAPTGGIFAQANATSNFFINRLTVAGNKIKCNSSGTAYMIDIRRAMNSVIQNNHIMAAVKGIQFGTTIEDCVIEGNKVEASSVCYRLSDSQGGNYVRNNIVFGGPPTTKYDLNRAAGLDFYAMDDWTKTITGGGNTLMPYGSTQIDSNGGAVSGTLGSGDFIGQIKTIVMIDATNPSTIQVTNHETSDPKAYAFSVVDETVVLLWSGTEWIEIKESIA